VRLSLERYQPVRRSQRRRALWLIGLSVPGSLFSSFWILLGILMLFFGDPGASGWEHRSAATVIILFGLLPLSVCLFMLWRGIAGWLRLGHYERLFALAQRMPGLPSQQAAATLGIGPALLARLVLDGARLGFIDQLDHSLLWPLAAGADAATSDTVVAPSPELLASPGGAAPRAAGASQAGLVLNGSYRLGALIGQGAMGDVYAATHARTGRRYAVKLLRRDLRLSDDAQRRFEREAKAVNRLGHPGIVAIHDYDRTADGTLFLVMDQLDGESLQTRLERRGTLPWPEARRIALELAAALGAAHRERLVHRDLKPGNVFLRREPDGSERAVLLDFGLAKPLDDGVASRITESRTAVGTPLYMSPEQARGENVDERSDVYGLAAVLYELVSGAPPFMDQTLAGVYARLLTQSAPSLSSVMGARAPAGLEAVLERALSKHRDDRYPTVEDFARALSALSALESGARMTA
jgi:tRNA A-37 threonylcarbamoyl transferase component Bud32